jgi:hypothetical protein
MDRQGFENWLAHEGRERPGNRRYKFTREGARGYADTCKKLEERLGFDLDGITTPEALRDACETLDIWGEGKIRLTLRVGIGAYFEFKRGRAALKIAWAPRYWLHRLASA